MDGMISGATGQLLQYGILGIFVIVFAFVIFRLWNDGAADRRDSTQRMEEFRKEHDKKLDEQRKEYDEKLHKIWQLRIEDARGYQTEFVDLVKNSITAMNNVSALLEANKDMMGEVKDAMSALADESRRRKERP